jgi:hypothetical protein
VTDRAAARILSALRNELPRADAFETSRHEATELAADHPLLLQLLLGPGFGDGLPVLPPSALHAPRAPRARAAPAAAATPQKPSAAGAAVDEETDPVDVRKKVDPARSGKKRALASDDEVVDEAGSEDGGARGGGGGGGGGGGRAAKRSALGSGSRPATAASSARRSSAGGKNDAGEDVVLIPSDSDGEGASGASGAARGGLANSSRPFGAGDGVRGGSILHALLSDLFRMSMMAIANTPSKRTLFFAATQLLQSLTALPALAAVALFVPQAEAPAPAEAPAAPATARGGGASASKRRGSPPAPAPAPPAARAWVFPGSLFELDAEPDVAALLPPATCVASLLAELHAQAKIFTKRSVASEAAPEVLMGSAAEDAE